ncbi:ATP12 family chaperone protein [Qipengyuania nanhaisediminis]|uniref:ATP12 family chaperone protein n=1 Tax=Qipengyuania nanhaisediminis TaxID=604088 RepID=UPI0038B35417
MKRFYKTVDIAEVSGPDGATGWQITLDGRAIKTVGGRAQRVPSRALAKAMASEWDRQGDKLDPSLFVLRDMADYAIDVVAEAREETADKVLRFGETDTLLYRADPDEPLFARQQEVWEPLVSAFEREEGVEMVRVSGIIHRPQAAPTLDTLRNRLRGMDAFALVAVEAMASLSASLIIALLASRKGADAESLWEAASLEENWQADLWGRDEEAEAVRARRRSDFLRAHGFAQMVLYPED